MRASVPPRRSIAAMLPYVDEHAITIAASRERVWAGLQRQVRALTRTDGSAFTRLLGTDPPAGFAVADSVPGPAPEPHRPAPLRALRARLRARRRPGRSHAAARADLR